MKPTRRDWLGRVLGFLGLAGVGGAGAAGAGAGASGGMPAGPAYSTYLGGEGEAVGALARAATFVYDPAARTVSRKNADGKEVPLPGVAWPEPLSVSVVFYDHPGIRVQHPI